MPQRAAVARLVAAHAAHPDTAAADELAGYLLALRRARGAAPTPDLPESACRRLGLTTAAFVAILRGFNDAQA